MHSRSRRTLVFATLLLSCICAAHAGTPASASPTAAGTIALQDRIAVPLLRNKTGLLVADSTVNGVAARLVVDTGASGSVFEAGSAARLKMTAGAALDNGAGAGGQVQLHAATGNTLRIGDWRQDRFDTVLMPLDHVNQAFIAGGDAPVDGVIGADVLVPAEAVIDYATTTLYLRPTTGATPGKGDKPDTDKKDTASE